MTAAPEQAAPRQATQARPHGHYSSRFRHDLLFYSASLAYILMTLLTGWPAYKMWATFAVVAVSASLLHVMFGRFARPTSSLSRRPLWSSRLVPVALTAVGSVSALVYMAQRRASGDVTAALSEVRIVERMAELLTQSGSPYLDVSTIADPVVFDYSPYSPMMSIFGLPSAFFGAHAWADARIFCIAASVGAVLVAMRSTGCQPSVSALQLMLNPLVLLMAAGSGTDVGVIGLMILGLVLAGSGRFGWSGACLSLAIAMKLTAAPVLLVAACLVWAVGGKAGVRTYLLTASASLVAYLLPVYLANPSAFVDNVLLYPAGLTEVTSSAAGPLPGHLLAMQPGWGKPAALGLLAVAVLLLGGWMIARPPASLSTAFVRTAVSLSVAMALLPASRVGYAIYPLTMLGAALAWRSGSAVENALAEEPAPI